MLVDSHCHLNYLDAPAMQLLAAREVGVTGFVCIGVDQSGIEAVLALRDTAEYLAALRGTTLEELAQTTTANFFALFNKAQNSSSNSR